MPILCLLLLIPFGMYVMKLDGEIRSKFDGKRWTLPAAVYARPLEIYPGLHLTLKMLEDELQLSGYRHELSDDVAGSYTIEGQTVRLVTRGFYFPSGLEPSRRLTVIFRSDQISALLNSDDHSPVDLARLDPAQIGSFHPLVHEDRILVTREEIPDIFVKTLTAIEDRHFFSHHGVSPLAILRALLADIRAGKAVQGGSTITQQLVKNFFLNREQTLVRKVKEAIMAVLLDLHYSKDEILTAYINEVYLGQDNNRAIHGFALASQYYFRRNFIDLRPDQIATLVGLVKGPSYYDPRRHPDICQQRRNTVLEIMAAQNIIDQGMLDKAKGAPLLEFTLQKNGLNRFPAFLDLVKAQLEGEYHEEDLRNNGLQILTTLDPQVQFQAENQLSRTIKELDRQTRTTELEGAAIVTSRETGDVLAVVGAKDPQQQGFNHALNARRQIGSLIKPAVYLTALNSGYTLANPLEDISVDLNDGSGKRWQPENYDHQQHGTIPLYYGLAHSLNLATVRLGLELGLPKVIETIHKLGYQGDIEPFPSLLLGSLSLAPIEICQMYQTISSGGFYSSLHAIESVMAADHSLLKRYGLAVEQRFSPDSVYLLSHAMQRVVGEGTAQSLMRTSLARYGIAGKTGTSNDLRDSWFTGFTGDHVCVVWVGRDDNTPIGLTGSTGALRVWTNIMAGVPTSALDLVEPEGINWQETDLSPFPQLVMEGKTSTKLPFMVQEAIPAEQNGENSLPSEEQGEQKQSKGVLDAISGWFK